MKKNIILNCDSYKTSHYLQYPPGTTRVSSYIESRGGTFDDVVFFGLQGFIKDYLLEPITMADIDEAEELIRSHGEPFNRDGWEHILVEHDGYLPIEIKAVPEGTVLGTKNVLVQVVNTDPNVPWLTSYVETALLRAVWYPTTVATLSREIKKTIKRALEKTGDSTDGLPFKLNDFGARGVSSEESAQIGGAAHLVSFAGSDTISAIRFVREYYAGDVKYMPSYSIIAAEHSTITAWGKAREVDAYANMLTLFTEPNQLVAVVSDSYDLWNAIDNLWGKELKEQVQNTGGTLVVRPDSGDPVEVVCETIERLMAKFGYSYTQNGYKVLPNCIRVIQGDGINLQSVRTILVAMDQRGLSAENLAFGMGGALLQGINRDTLKFAMKASAIEIDGVWHDVYKDPATDTGKRSKRGILALTKDAPQRAFKTVRQVDLGGRPDFLETVFKNGMLLKNQDFEEIRERAAV